MGVMAGTVTDDDIKQRADVDGDGSVDIGDILTITGVAAGKE